MGAVQQRLNLTKPQAFAVMFAGLAVLTLTCFAAALSSVTILNMPKV